MPRGANEELCRAEGRAKDAWAKAAVNEPSDCAQAPVKHVTRGSEESAKHSTPSPHPASAICPSCLHLNHVGIDNIKKLEER